MDSSRCWMTETVMGSVAMPGTIHVFELRGILAAVQTPRRRGPSLSPLPKEVGLMSHTRRHVLKTAAGAAAASGALVFPMVSRAQQKKLTVWWNRGYYKEEDEAMLKVADEFLKGKNVERDISFTLVECPLT